MQVNNGNEALIADIDFLCDTSSTSYPTAAKIRNINRWAYRAHVAMIKGSERWQIDDSNLTTLPHLKADLVAGQADYRLPSGYLRLNRVEIMDSNGDYKKLTPIDQGDIKGAYTEFEETDGEPKYYDMVGDTILLKPAPAAADVTTTNGLRIHILREIDIFTTGDTTQEPGFPEPFHRILSFGASYDYLISRGDYEKAQSYRNEAEILMGELQGFSAQMLGDEHIRIRPAHRTQSYL